jgi:hypothetical protein
MSYEIRTAPVPALPRFAVTRVDEKGFGTDIAWFFNLGTAMRFAEKLNRHERLRRKKRSK